MRDGPGGATRNTGGHCAIGDFSAAKAQRQSGVGARGQRNGAEERGITLQARQIEREGPRYVDGVAGRGRQRGAAHGQIVGQQVGAGRRRKWFGLKGHAERGVAGYGAIHGADGTLRQTAAGGQPHGSKQGKQK